MFCSNKDYLQFLNSIIKEIRENSNFTSNDLSEALDDPYDIHYGDEQGQRDLLNSLSKIRKMKKAIIKYQNDFNNLKFQWGYKEYETQTSVKFAELIDLLERVEQRYGGTDVYKEKKD